MGEIIWLTLALAILVGAVVTALRSESPMARIGLGFTAAAMGLVFLSLLLT